MIISEKLFYLLCSILVIAIGYSIIKGEDMKKIAAKFFFSAFLIAFLHDPELLIKLGTMLANILFGAGDYLKMD